MSATQRAGAWPRERRNGVRRQADAAEAGQAIRRSHAGVGARGVGEEFGARAERRGRLGWVESGSLPSSLGRLRGTHRISLDGKVPFHRTPGTFTGVAVGAALGHTLPR